MSNEKPEALELADKLKNAIQLLDMGFDEDIDPDELDKAALELEHLHARVQELEAMLDAVGAGVVSAQRVTQADASDAERWRFIKRKLYLTGNGDGTCAMQALNLPARILGWPDVGELAIAQFLDTAIDAAIAAAKENK